MTTTSTVDLHALFANRAIGKLRSFLSSASNRGGGGGTNGGGKNAGGGVGAHGLSRSPGASGGGGGGMAGSAVNAEVNRRDHLGRTVLHLAVMEVGDWALEWVDALLNVPGLLVNAMDTESGWSALHRALYAGNIAAARQLLMRDDVDSRLKDHEGLTPFDLYNSTVEGTNPTDSLPSRSAEAQGKSAGRRELFTWGANRNYVLGFAGDGDRAFPERVQLKREESGALRGVEKFEPLRINDVVLARLHSGILTDERSNNVRLCGYGTGGRLGQNAQTQFTFTSLADFPHEVASIVLSPDHTVIVTTIGAVFTFGLNRSEQLGYALDLPTNSSTDDPIQSTPRRVVGALKKEVILGAAASRTHTAVFSSDALFTWGTSRGQLGYALQGSQVLPRKVTQIDAPCIQLCATENATACLLQSKDVLVLYHDHVLKIVFPLARFPSKMQAYRPPQVSSKPNIDKLASCGNTFAALSSLGDVFSFTLDSSTATSGLSSPSPSTPTFDSLARLTPKPQRIWSLRRKFTAVTDVGVGLDGAIILSTVSGHVFVRTRKFESNSGKSSSSTPATPPTSSSRSNAGWKFSRVPYLQRCIRVAANSTGAFAAIRADVPMRPIEVVGPSLAESFLHILPHWVRLRVDPGETLSKLKRGANGEDSDDEGESDLAIDREIIVALQLLRVIDEWDSDWEMPRAGADAVVVVGRLRIPVHRLLMDTRSDVWRATENTYELKCSEMAALLLLHYVYTDELPAIWDPRVGSRLRELQPSSRINFGTVKSELQQLSQALGLAALASSLDYHIRTSPAPTLSRSLQSLFTAASLSSPTSPIFSSRADLVLVLADREVVCHSTIVRARCSVFETFYEDTDWTSLRLEGADGGMLRFDLKHWTWEVMRLVMEHLYFDAGVEMFDTIEKPTADEYIDFVTQVLAAANELLLDKLKLVCSAVLRRFVTLYNVCAILVDAAFFEAGELVGACMHFLASSMETVLEGRLLDDLPPDLLTAVSTFCRERQGARMPISRSGLLVNEAVAKHSAFLADLDVGRPTGGARKWRPVLPRSPGPSPSLLSPGPSPHLLPRTSPTLRPQPSPPMRPARDMEEPFAMDEDFALDSTPSRRSSATVTPRRPSHPSSPSTPSFTPLGSPPPPRLQPWTKMASESSRPPLDLRGIMASEAASRPRPVVGLTPSQRPAAPPPSTSRSTFASPSWRAPESPRPSLIDIQSAQSISSRGTNPSTRPETSRPITQRAPSTGFVLPPPSAATFPPTSNFPLNPSSAIGAPVITPSRPTNRVPSGSWSTPKASFGAADVPWTNYTVAPPSPILDPFTSFSVSPPLASFASIQLQQRAEVEAIKETKAPRSFADVMAQEAQEARERAEAEEFERWWAAESEKVKVESSSGASRGGKGRGGKGGKSARGSPRPATKTSPTSKEAAKSSSSPSSTSAIPPAASPSTSTSTSSRRGRGAGRGGAGGNRGGAGKLPLEV